MTRRVVVHAGFHKTGTTSMQAFLASNGPVLWPVMALGMRYKFSKLLSAARGYSTWRDPISLEKFRRRFEAYLGELKLGKRDLLISAEELSGHLPGRDDVLDYGAAPALMREIEDVLLQAFPHAKLTFVFTLRQPETWWPSAYWEHVKSSRLTLDFDAFRDRHSALILEDEARRIQVKSDVREFWIEDISGLAHGPATPLLELMALDADRQVQLKPVPAQNCAPMDRAALIEKLLMLNRSNLDDASLGIAKQNVLQAASEDGRHE